MRAPYLERALTAPVARHLRASGYRTFEEVYFNGRIADLVGVKGEEVVAVELKLRDFKQAHRQAVAYQVGCHRSFVGLPLERALECLRQHRHEFETSGAGLLAVRMPEGDTPASLDAGSPPRRNEADVRELLPARHHEGRFLPFLADALRGLG
jgi:hypothetical protein